MATYRMFTIIVFLAISILQASSWLDFTVHSGSRVELEENALHYLTLSWWFTSASLLNSWVTISWCPFKLAIWSAVWPPWWYKIEYRYFQQFTWSQTVMLMPEDFNTSRFCFYVLGSIFEVEGEACEWGYRCFMRTNMRTNIECLVFHL